MTTKDFHDGRKGEMLRCLRAIKATLSPKNSTNPNTESTPPQNRLLPQQTYLDLLTALRALLNSLWQTNSREQLCKPIAAQILQELYVLLLNLVQFKGITSAQRRVIRLLVPALVQELSDGVLPPVWRQNFGGKFSGYDDRSFGGSATVLAPALSLLVCLGDAPIIESNVAALRGWIREGDESSSLGS